MTIRTPHFFSFVIAWFLICSLVQADTLREYLQRKCNEGEEKSCQRAEAMLQGEKLGDRIVELGDRFAATVDRLNREDNNKPIHNTKPHPQNAPRIEMKIMERVEVDEETGENKIIKRLYV